MGKPSKKEFIIRKYWERAKFPTKLNQKKIPKNPFPNMGKGPRKTFKEISP